MQCFLVADAAVIVIWEIWEWDSHFIDLLRPPPPPLGDKPFTVPRKIEIAQPNRMFEV